MELITALATLTIPLLVTSGAIASLPIPTTSLPVCEYEDGSSQAACVCGTHLRRVMASDVT